MLHAEGRAADLLAPHDVLLLGERRAVPELHEHADHAHHVVRAAHGPGRLAVAAGHPDVAVHGRAGARVEVGRAVDEAHQVARRAGGAGGGAAAAGEAVEHPAQHQGAAGAAHELAQREEHRVGVLGLDAQQQVAVAALGVQAVVRARKGMVDQLARAARGEPVALVEQRRADADDDGEVVRRRVRPEQAGVGRRVGGVARLGRPALHEAGDLVRELAHQLGQLGAVAREHGERGHQPRRGRRLERDAGLVGAGEGHEARAGRAPVAVGAAPAAGRQEAAAHRHAARPGEERAPRDAAPGHERPSAPGTSARSSDSPASCAFIRSIWAWVTVGFGHRLDGNSSFCRQKRTHPSPFFSGARLGLQLLEARPDAGQQLGVGVLEGGGQHLDDLLRALDVRVEVPEVGLGVAVLLAGDLALGDLLDQLRGAQRDGRRRDLERLQARLQLLQVGVEPVGERRRALGGALLPEQVLQAVPAGEGRVVRAREVVDPRVHGAVDLLDQAGDRLDALPALAAGGVGGARRPAGSPPAPRS